MYECFVNTWKGAIRCLELINPKNVIERRNTVSEKEWLLLTAERS
jgi:hypothetical protein